MLRTQIFPSHIPRTDAEALNAESGRVYTQTLIWHWRTYRHSEHWLSQYAAMRLGDSLSGTTLHAHSRDAAQEGFYKASKAARTNKSPYPHHRKNYRTTIWKN